MFVLGNVIKPQGLEPLQFPTKFRAPSLNRLFFMAPPRPEDAILSSFSWSEKRQAGQTRAPNTAAMRGWLIRP